MSADGKGQGPGHDAGGGRISPEDRDAIRKRSADIGHKLDAVTAKRAPAGEAGHGGGQSAYGQAYRFAADLMVGVVAGGVLGWALDRQFGTAPWLMIVLFLLGFAAGLRNVVRAAKKAQALNEPQQRAAPSVADDDDDEK